MLTLIAIIAFVSIPYALDVHFDASRKAHDRKKDGNGCCK